MSNCVFLNFSSGFIAFFGNCRSLGKWQPLDMTQGIKIGGKTPAVEKLRI